MKSLKTPVEPQVLSREASRICCLTRVNSLLKSLRMKHRRADPSRLQTNALTGPADNEEVVAPTRHDYCVSELEASVVPDRYLARLPDDTLIAFDSAREIARAKLVFAATLAVPLLLVAITLGLFNAQMARAETALLQFSALVLATPLIFALARTALRSGWQGIRQHPWLALLGATAAGGYASSALAMSVPVAATTSAFALSIAGLLVMAVQFGHWLRVIRARQ
jgi:cation transport ATPase